MDQIHLYGKSSKHAGAEFSLANKSRERTCSFSILINIAPAKLTLFTVGHRIIKNVPII